MRILPGLTGIVGPNGCGKSNLVEALRWVMGESSAKRLRGGEMDDVIFAGAAGRPARNQAEVTLRLENPDLDAPVQFNDATTLEVTRKVVRNQGSAYRVNGRDHRAQDLKLLFADLASGAASNAMVAQGRVAAIVNARPTDRRALLEEAAGITGLYSRRREAENRLRATEGNLERVADMQQAKQSQRRTLERQAQSAKRYGTLQEQRRALAAALAYLQWQEVERELAKANKVLSDVEVECEQLHLKESETARAEAEANEKLEPLRLAHAEAAARVQRLSLALDALQNEERGLVAKREDLARQLAECGDDLSREQGNFEASKDRLERLADEEAGLKEQRQIARPKVAALEAELSESETAERQAADALREAATQLSTARNERLTLTTRITSLEERAEALRGRLAASAAAPDFVGPDAEAIDALIQAQEAKQAGLENQESNLASHRDGAGALTETREAAQGLLTQAREAQTRTLAEIEGLRALLKGAAKSSDQHTRLGQVLKVAEGFAVPVAAALADGIDAALKEIEGDYWTEQQLTSAPALPAGLSSLKGAVQEPAWLSGPLSYVGLAQDAAQAAALQPELQPGQSLTTPEGGLWRWDGFVAGLERNAGQAALIERGQRLEALEEEVDALEAAVTKAEADLARAKEAVQSHSKTGEELSAAIRDGQRDLARQGQQIAEAQRALAKHRAQIAEQEAERVGTQRELETLEAELRGLDQAQEALGGLNALEAQVAQAQETHEGTQAKVREQREVLEGAKRDLISTDARLGAILTETFTFEGQLKNAAAQLDVLKARAEALEAEGAALAARPDELRAQAADLSEKCDQATADQNNAGDALAAAQTSLRELRQAAQAALSAHGDARECRARLQAEQSAAQDRVGEVARQVYETFKRPAADLLELTDASSPEELPSRGDASQRMQRLDRQIDQIGPVNLAAEQELEELSGHLADIEREVEELTKAINKLRKVIRDLNQEGRLRLKTAFDQVSTHFSSLFQRLFGGGKARLELVESDDPLEAGLEISASPPGKRLQSLTLLSGGEQTMTALALIFAMFRANPAPLCVLDEVDAPLDDANVDRMCSLLEDMAAEVGTRFLIVTHNALTMARVDRLFGVTMAERGVSRLVSVDLQEAVQYQGS